MGLFRFAVLSNGYLKLLLSSECLVFTRGIKRIKRMGGNMLIALEIGISITAFLFVWALLIIARKPAPKPPEPLPEYYAKYFDKLLTSEEIATYNREKWDRD